MSSPSGLHLRQVRPRQSVATGAVATGPAALGVWMASFMAVVESSLLARGPKAMPPNREYFRPAERFPAGLGHRDTSGRPGLESPLLQAAATAMCRFGRCGTAQRRWERLQTPNNEVPCGATGLPNPARAGRRWRRLGRSCIVIRVSGVELRGLEGI